MEKSEHNEQQLQRKLNARLGELKRAIETEEGKLETFKSQLQKIDYLMSAKNKHAGTEELSKEEELAVAKYLDYASHYNDDPKNQGKNQIATWDEVDWESRWLRLEQFIKSCTLKIENLKTEKRQLENGVLRPRLKEKRAKGIEVKKLETNFNARVLDTLVHAENEDTDSEPPSSRIPPSRKRAEPVNRQSIASTPNQLLI